MPPALGTILIKADKAGVQSVGVKGFEIPTDANGQLWVHFAHHDPAIYVSAVDVMDNACREKIAGKLVLIGTSSVGLNDIKTTPVSRDARCRDPRPGAGSALTGAVVSQPNYGIGVGVCTALMLGMLVIAFAPMFGPITLVRRRGCSLAAGRNVLVFLRAAPAADRLYLPPAVDHGDLPDADFLELRPGAGAAPADPLRLRPVSVARAGRAAGAVAGKTRARRRRARDDHHVLRHARLHLDFGDLQERSAGPHRADEPLPDAADQRDPRPQGHHRQIHGRRHHGVLERAARRQGAPDQCLRGGARHARARR